MAGPGAGAPGRDSWLRPSLPVCPCVGGLLALILSISEARTQQGPAGQVPVGGSKQILPAIREERNWGPVPRHTGPVAVVLKAVG